VTRTTLDSGEVDSMASKVARIPVEDPQAPDLSAVVSSGLRLRGFEELYFVAGHGDLDADFRVRHPGDPLTQTRAVFDDLTGMLAEAGYDLDDVVTAEVTVTREFDLARNIEALHRIWAEVFADVAVKPAAGQLRVADALAVPGMLVEIEPLTAR
jgi:enamine deaminase RidA (YjgF/YER057c/UK114 family)